MSYTGKNCFRRISAVSRGCDNGPGNAGRGMPEAAGKRAPLVTASVLSVFVAHALTGVGPAPWTNAAWASNNDSQLPAPIVLAQANATTSTTTTITTSNDSMQMARTRELIAADHREIDTMAARIKEMIEARYRADALHIKSQETITELRERIAELEEQLKNADGDYKALLAERADLNQQLNLMQAERDSAREDINTLAGELDNQRDTVDSLRADAEAAAQQLANRQATVNELTEKLGAQASTGEELEKNLSVTEDKLKDRDRQLALAEERLADARQQLGSLRDQLADLKTDRNKALDEIASLKLQRDSADVRANGLLSERDNLTGKLGLFQSRTDDVSNELQAEREQHAATRAAVASLEDDIDELQDDIKDATRQRNTLVAQRKGLEGEKARLTTDLDEVKKQLLLANRDLETRQAELKIAHGELEDVTGQLNVANAELEDLNGQLVSANNEIGKLNSHIGKLDKKVASLNKDHNQAQASINSLKSNGSSLQDQLEKARKLAASKLATAQNDLKNEKESFQKQIDRRDRDLIQLNGRVSELSSELATLSEQSANDINGRDARIADLESQLAELQQTRDSLMAEGERANDTMENLHNLIASLEGKEKASADKLLALQNQYDALRGNGEQEVEDLQLQLSQSEDKLRLATEKLNAMLLEQKTLEAERDAVFSEAEKLRIALTDELRAAQLENVTVQNARADNSIPLRLGNADFFAVGSAELTKEGGENLKKLAEIISTFDDRRIVVEGHTDNVGIGLRLRSKFYSNWELSVARAAAAVRHMQHQSNIDPYQLSAVGYGEYAPVASNDTAEGRQMNRRVEVVLYPRDVNEEQYSSIDE